MSRESGGHSKAAMAGKEPEKPSSAPTSPRLPPTSPPRTGGQGKPLMKFTVGCWGSGSGGEGSTGVKGRQILNTRVTGSVCPLRKTILALKYETDNLGYRILSQATRMGTGMVIYDQWERR